jgi:membrane-associated protein
MEILTSVWEFIGHLDEHLAMFYRDHGALLFGLLFVIVFCETGLVVTPFLPGDSLLFAAGALSASVGISPITLFLTLVAAALCGDNCNYWIGRALGPHIARGRGRLVNRRALERTEQFYERHGRKTVVLARFVPIVRTFAPFVAGLGHMPYARFLTFCVIGGIAWVGSMLGCGYLFGQIPWVKEHFEWMVVGVVVISLLPLAFEFLRHRFAAPR